MSADFNDAITTLTPMGTNLYVGGECTLIGTTPHKHIARWNGVAWRAVGTGLSSPVYALVANDTTLMAGGTFTTVGDDSFVSGAFGIRNPPILESPMIFSPAAARLGQTVTVSLTYPRNLVGLTNLTLNGVAITTYSVNANGQIVFTVPSGATTGPLVFTVGGRSYESITPLTVLPNGLSESALTLAAFTLTPVPATDQVLVSGATGQIRVSDLLGRVIRTAYVEQEGTWLDLRGLAAGAYIVRSDAGARRLVVE